MKPDDIRDACRHIREMVNHPERITYSDPRQRNNDMTTIMTAALAHADMLQRIADHKPTLEVGRPDEQPTFMGVGPIAIEIAVSPDGKLVTTLRVSG